MRITRIDRTKAITIYQEIVDKLITLFKHDPSSGISDVIGVLREYYPESKKKSLEIYGYEYLKYLREHNLMPGLEQSEKKPEVMLESQIGKAQGVELKEPPKMSESTEIPSDLLLLLSKLPEVFNWFACRDEIKKVFGNRRLVSTTNSMLRLCKSHNLITEVTLGNYRKVNG